MKTTKTTTDSYKIQVPIEEILNIVKKAILETSPSTKFGGEYGVSICLVSGNGRQHVPITANFEFTWNHVRDKITLD